MADVKTPITTDTTRIVSDRLAKIATTYTNGFTRVVYVGHEVKADCNGTIFLPATMRDFKSEDETLAWAFTAHEMGHQAVENDLRTQRALKSTAKAGATEAIFNLVPPELQHIAVKPGARLLLTTEWLKALPAWGKEIAGVYGGSPGSAARQIQMMVNVFEDPRQEAMVSAKWLGAAQYIERGNEHALEKWRKLALDIIAAGRDSDFTVYGVGVLFALHGVDTTFLGPVVNMQIAAVRDVIDLFRSEGNWRTANGFFDAVNAALITISRVYRRETSIPSPKPACPECGSVRIKATFRKPNRLTVICLDCGQRDESEVSFEGAPDVGGIGMEVEVESTPEGSDDSEAGEGAGSPEEASDDAGDEESGDGDAEGAEAEGNAAPGAAESGGDAPSADSGPDESADADSTPGEGGPKKKGKLTVGMVIRVKSTGGKALITAIHPDGTIEVEDVVDDVVSKKKAKKAHK